MDAYEASRMVYSRVQAMEPDHVSKIIGYLLLQDQGDQEMFCLAFSHDALLQALVSKVKKDLGLSSSSPSRASTLTSPQQQYSSPFHLPYHLAPPASQPLPRSVPASSEYLNSLYYGSHVQDDRISPSPDQSLHGHENHSSPGFSRFASQDRLPVHERLSEHLFRHDMQLSDQFSFLNENHESPNASSHDYLHPDMLAIFNGKLNVDNYHARSNDRHFSTSDVLLSPDSVTSAAWRPCLYYARGYCKHGSSCRFLHTHVRPDSSLLTSPNNGQQDSGSDDGLMPGSLEILEMELQELLRGRKAPVSIASLPQLYYERFGKTLQAEGYLTESQRHGKAGYSLTKLLARLKNSVTLIDRPHGQHAVVLAEDAYKFTSYRGDKDDLSGVNPGSRQIYLTFPAESAFTEEDVSSHFRVYGPVQDVRIPHQQKRMFGFVTFIYPETVKMILAKGNPHYICGARVLVKPYKEKGKHGDRKFSDREYPRLGTGQGLDSREYDFISGPRFFLEHDLLRRQLEEQELIIELERRRLADLQLEKQRRQSQSVSATAAVVAVSQAPQVIVANGFSPEDVTRPSEGWIHTLCRGQPKWLHRCNAGAGPSSLPLQLSFPFARADLQHIQTSSAFEFLVDALDSNGQGEELESKEKQPKTMQSDEHNLPDSPFTSPHKSFAPPDLVDDLTLEGLSGPPGLVVSSASPDTVKELNCRICMDFFDDPMELDCGHVFCVQCVLKVIRVSKDECPICRRHIGSQIVKLLESRRLQVIDPNLTKGAQAIW